MNSYRQTNSLKPTAQQKPSENLSDPTETSYLNLFMFTLPQETTIEKLLPEAIDQLPTLNNLVVTAILSQYRRNNKQRAKITKTKIVNEFHLSRDRWSDLVVESLNLLKDIFDKQDIHFTSDFSQPEKFMTATNI